MQGDNIAFEYLFERYKEAIHRLFIQRTNNPLDADDLLQETFIKVYRSFHSLKEAKALRSWIYRIATNEALRFIERNKTPRLLTESIDDSATDIAATDYTDYTDLEAVKLQKAILSLPPKQQATFNMRYYDEMEYQQIAEAMEISSWFKDDWFNEKFVIYVPAT